MKSEIVEPRSTISYVKAVAFGVDDADNHKSKDGVVREWETMTLVAALLLGVSASGLFSVPFMEHLVQPMPMNELEMHDDVGRRLRASASSSNTADNFAARAALGGNSTRMQEMQALFALTGHQARADPSKSPARRQRAAARRIARDPPHSSHHHSHGRDAAQFHILRNLNTMVFCVSTFCFLTSSITASFFQQFALSHDGLSLEGMKVVLGWTYFIPSFYFRAGYVTLVAGLALLFAMIMVRARACAPLARCPQRLSRTPAHAAAPPSAPREGQ